MNPNFPPRQFAAPSILKKKAERRRPVPLTTEQIARRTEVARVLGLKVDILNKALKSLSPEQRKAVFYKVTHTGAINLTGTGLKPLVDRSEHVTLAIPKDENLDAFEAKIDSFGSGAISAQNTISHQSYFNVEDIVRGEPKDRLSDELLADYETLIKTKQPSIICEIELLSLAQGKNQKRDEIRDTLKAIYNAFASGVHGTLFEHEEGDGVCRAVIRVSGDVLRRLVEDEEWQMRISWFEPKPRFETFHTILKDFQFDKLGSISPPSEDAPTICVIDSGVSAGNPFLQPVTREDLLISFLKEEPDDPADANGHGSGVASLAAYYALKLAEGEENEAKAWIASARILQENNQIEEERLLSKIIEEVVETFVPLGVRIFNLSVGDLSKKWNPDNKRTQSRTSWTARTIDRLSREHDVVFVVSTGNILRDQIRDYIEDGIPYPQYLCGEESRILDPGQAGLAVGVGSIAAGTLVANSPDTTIALDFEPSPFTRSGPGIKGETKPDLVEIGGNLVSQPDAGTVRGNIATNVVMASHQLTPATAHNYGTSFSTPRVSHKLALLLQELQNLGLDQISAPLLKAFLTNSAVYDGDLTDIREQLGTVSRKQYLQVLGHGRPDSARATECDKYSMLMYYQGELAFDEVAFFNVPIPAKFSESAAGKRITVTVAHYPEVQRWGLESYFGIDLKWRMYRGDVDRDEILDKLSKSDEAEDHANTADGAPDEIPFEHKVTRRSRGSVQHDWFDWKAHKQEHSENHYTLAVSAQKRWGRKPQPTKFAVVIRVEDIGGTLPIYAEIAAELDILIEQQAQV